MLKVEFYLCVSRLSWRWKNQLLDLYYHRGGIDDDQEAEEFHGRGKGFDFEGSPSGEGSGV